jgi:hypothetical protein
MNLVITLSPAQLHLWIHTPAGSRPPPALNRPAALARCCPVGLQNGQTVNLDGPAAFTPAIDDCCHTVLVS